MDSLKKNNVTVCGNNQSDTTMLFVHGFGTHQASWKDIVPAFEKDFRIVLLDNVGAGGSDIDAYNQERYTNLEVYSDDLLEICKTLRLENVVLVGHSAGAMIGALAALKQPQLFSKLVLIGASSRYLDDPPQYKGGFTDTDLDGLFQTMTGNFYAWVTGFASMAMANPDRPSLAEQFATSLSGVRPDIAISVAKVIFKSDYRREISGVQQPVLLIQSQEDIAVPLSAAEFLRDHIRNSKLEVIEATGHFPHMSAPDKVISAIKPYLFSA